METKNIYHKLFEAKKEIGKISKDSTNPFYDSKYFDINGLLEHVEPILEKYNLLLLQPIQDGSVMTIIYDLEDTESSVFSAVPLPQLNDPQKLGSAITYYRRFTLQSLLGLQAEDDDANLASNTTTQQPKAVVKAVIKTLTQPEVDKKWNGKIYGNKFVYIDNVKCEIPQEQITKLKTLPKYKKDEKTN